MNKRFLAIIILLVAIAIVAYLFFALGRQNNFFGTVKIRCGDTLELSYNNNARLMITVDHKCGDSLKIEVKRGRNQWQPLETRQNTTLGPAMKPVNFDQNNVALVNVGRNDKLRIICKAGELDSCRVTIANFDEMRAFRGIYSNSQTNNCRDTIKTGIYNFTTTPPPVPLVLRINWASACGTTSGGVFTPTQPKILTKDNNRLTLDEQAGAAIRAKQGNTFEMEGFILNGNTELFILCPGNDGNCQFSISAKR